MSCATSPNVLAERRSTTLVLWPSEMAMLPAATPRPPLSCDNGVLDVTAGVNVAPWIGCDIAPNA